MIKAPLLLSALLLVACTTTTNEEVLVITSSSSSSQVSEAQSSVTVDTVTSTYNGEWFSVEYPTSFTVAPNEPVTTFNDYTYIETDEAYFTSPDGLVEFYVFSPLWRGEPDYLTILDNEMLIDKHAKAQPGTIGDTEITWGTFTDVNNEYTRSYVSTRRQLGTGSDTHQVFGFKYANEAAYTMYKDVYTAFKNSLQQYAD